MTGEKHSHQTAGMDNPVYTCPMHPEITSHKPGTCPKCGMALEPRQKSGHDEHDKHAGHSVAMFQNKFWASLAATIPVLLYSQSVQHLLKLSPPAFAGSTLIPFVFSTFIFFYGGLVFIRGAISELKAKLPGMMTLISLAISVAYLYSVAVNFFIPGEDFFWELATLTTVMLLGHWMEMSHIAKAENALGAIAKLMPDMAERLEKGKPVKVQVSLLKPGDLVLVRPGGSIPVDGIVQIGRSSINEAAITGESKPVSKSVGDEVIAGTINQDGALTIKVTKIGEDTVLAGIMRLVAEAAASKSRTQVLADKAAFWLTLMAITVGAATFIFWLINRDSLFALERAVTVLVIACPHALGLAVPAVVSISSALSASNGILVRKRLALESARNLDIILFDKTGTLTKGEHGVTNVWAAKGYDIDSILHSAASLEQNSEHIIGRAIVKYAEDKGIGLHQVANFNAIPGFGVKGSLHGKPYIAASFSYIEQQKLKVPSAIDGQVKQAAKEGKSEVYLIEAKKVIGAIALADVVREESKPTIQALKQLGIKTAMITGDSKDVAANVAKQLGLDQYFAEERPDGKAGKVKQLQQQGLRVAMVGDGINDAPALTQADIGIAIGAGTDVAIKSADIILVKSNPSDVVKIVKLSKATYRKMAQNLAWATGYNIIAIPLAAGVLYRADILLAPALGALFMSLSTVIVAINAQLLRKTSLS